MVLFPRPKKEIGKKVTNGAVAVAKMPWKIVSKLIVDQHFSINTFKLAKLVNLDIFSNKCLN